MASRVINFCCKTSTHQECDNISGKGQFRQPNTFCNPNSAKNDLSAAKAGGLARTVCVAVCRSINDTRFSMQGQHDINLFGVGAASFSFSQRIRRLEMTLLDLSLVFRPTPYP